MDRAEELLAGFLERARRAGMLPWIGLASANQRWRAMRRGEVGLGETTALDSLALSHERSFAFWIPMALGVLQAPGRDLKAGRKHRSRAGSVDGVVVDVSS